MDTVTRVQIPDETGLDETVHLKKHRIFQTENFYNQATLKLWNPSLTDLNSIDPYVRA